MEKEIYHKLKNQINNYYLETYRHFTDLASEGDFYTYFDLISEVKNVHHKIHNILISERIQTVNMLEVFNNTNIIREKLGLEKYDLPIELSELSNKVKNNSDKKEKLMQDCLNICLEQLELTNNESIKYLFNQSLKEIDLAKYYMTNSPRAGKEINKWIRKAYENMNTALKELGLSEVPCEL